MSTIIDQEISDPICTVDPYEYTQIKLNSDGSITRLYQFPSIPATPNPASPSPVLSSDIPLNTSYSTSVRIFIPKAALSEDTKIPIIVYSHGGGFVLLHVDTCYNHAFCEELALRTSTIVVSVEYRLAPEHRLPAAYEDVLHVLVWIRDGSGNEKCDWLSRFGDFENVFLMGTSAGGNIAYHAAVRSLDIADDLRPVRLKGLILTQPFFGGSNRTVSEIRHINHLYLPLSGGDLFWEFGLPVGATRDHEFCNPKTGYELGWFERLKESDLQVLVADCSGDPLVDRNTELVAMLKEKGVTVEAYFTEGGFHGVELLDTDQAKREAYMQTVREFIHSCVDAPRMRNVA